MNKDTQNRREFFKKAAKKALPLLGVITISSLSIQTVVEENIIFRGKDCNNNCKGSCKGKCEGNCAENGCKGGCYGSCSGSCSNTSKGNN